MSQLATPTTQSPTATPIPDTITSPSAKLVYFYLERAGPTTISTLSTALDMQKLSLYSVLDALSGKGLVECDGETYGLSV